MKPIPINLAEAIIDPLWDPQLSELSRWTVTPGPDHGLRVYQNWCWAGFEWTRRPAHGPALRMSRRFDLACTPYDRLMISIMAPEHAILRLTAQTDRGQVEFAAPPASGQKREHVIDLEGAARLDSITLEIIAADDGPANGWINWIGLQDSALLPRHLAQFARFDAAWTAYLKPESYEPTFTPAYGILINAAELAAFRAEHDAFLARHGASPFTVAAEAAARLAPEAMIHDYVNFWNDTRYCRERDGGHLLLRHGPAAAIGGLLLRDKTLLRLAARYALAIAMCEHWDDGFICAFPGSNFEHRCFVQSLCTHDTALILDLAGELFTDIGREYILRRIAEEGLASINFNTWKHEYIFHCNQLAWFTPGRMLGYLALERAMPRARPYTELACADLIESLDATILPDGGYVEGPTYFRCVARDGGLALYYYARSRGRPYRSVIPDAMARTAGFGAAIASTDDAADAIPICDARPLLEQEGLAVMAALLPESAWAAMYRKSVNRTGGLPETTLAWQLGREIPPSDRPLPAFVSLPEMGIMASMRHLGAETVKLLIMGNRAGAGHTHEDKGSFVLEFAGDTFALDPGTCDYSHPLSFTLKQCQRHNMLAPVGMAERPHPANPIPADVKPRGAGDAVGFHAEIDATPGWEAYFRRWVRAWDSPTPDALTIRDDYELAHGAAVEFYWNTKLPVELAGRVITISGRRGQATLIAPADCAVRIEDLPLLDGEVQHRIAFRREGRAGQIEVQARLHLYSDHSR